ncbi:hypothetical protein ACIGQE_29100 [Streptomyces sp. NPDC053429]|uniref:hypothetical protein n=1 Tax=Streptomyces sp. NPDC053429 TaxID=3365702 RepID=UPI0037D46C1A
MHAYTLASVAVPVTAGLVGAVRGRAAVRHRRALDRWAVVLAYPYQAALERWWPNAVQAAGARLLLDGLVTVNHRGNLSPAPAAADPARKSSRSGNPPERRDRGCTWSSPRCSSASSA